MDTGDTYLKMSEEAVKYLGNKTHWEEGDLYAYAINDKECPSLYTNVRLIHYCERDNLDTAFPIYRQDQLQAMIEDPIAQATEWFYNLQESGDPFYCYTGNISNPAYWKHFTSMEQLWLAFVMKERYQKIWDGSNWVNEAIK